MSLAPGREHRSCRDASETRAAARIPIRCAPRKSRCKRAPTGSPRICARIAAISATTISPRLVRESACRSISKWRRPSEMLAIALQRAAPCLLHRAGAARGDAPPKAGSTRRARMIALAPIVRALNDAGIRVSLFIDADRRQFEAAAALGAPVVELHTGRLSRRRAGGRCGATARQLERIARGAAAAAAMGLEVHAGPWPDLRECGAGRRHPRDRRTTNRSFSGRRGDFRRPENAIARMRAIMDEARSLPLDAGRGP